MRIKPKLLKFGNKMKELLKKSLTLDLEIQQKLEKVDSYPRASTSQLRGVKLK